MTFAGTVEPDRAAEGLTYRVGFPALLVVLVGLCILLAWLLPPLTRALVSVGAGLRLGAGVISGGIERQERAEAAQEARAEARHREAMTAIGDVKATVVARL